MLSVACCGRIRSCSQLIVAQMWRHLKSRQHSRSNSIACPLTCFLPLAAAVAEPGPTPARHVRAALQAAMEVRSGLRGINNTSLLQTASCVQPASAVSS